MEVWGLGFRVWGLGLQIQDAAACDDELSNFETLHCNVLQWLSRHKSSNAKFSAKSVSRYQKHPAQQELRSPQPWKYFPREGGRNWVQFRLVEGFDLGRGEEKAGEKEDDGKGERRAGEHLGAACARGNQP